MKKNKKMFFNTDSFGIILLLILTVFSGYMGCNERFSKDLKVEKVTTNSKNFNRSSYSDYDYDDNDDYYDNYDEYYDDNWYNNDGFYTDTDNYYYNSNSEYESNYTGYKNYDDSYYNYDYNYYKDTNKPAIRISASSVVYQYENFDPWDGISAHHSKFGDVTDIIEIVHNDLDVNIPGQYSIVYKACNYPGSIYCRTLTRQITVKQKEDPNYYYTKGPVWEKLDIKSCSLGSTNCKASKIKEPIASDPYSGRELDVTLIDGNVDIYTPGTYVLVYYTETENQISGTNIRIVTIEDTNNYYDDNYDDDYYYGDDYNDNYKQKKYIDNHYEEYYDDGTYRGTLKPNYNYNQISKYIQDYKWTNKVFYTYKCSNLNQYGINGWEYISTDTSDDNPTYEYNIGNFSGTLEKNDFYCVRGQGCDEDVDRQLGTCSNLGEKKQITRTWVGLYSGYVYANQEETYSGYVYRYR